MRAYNRVEGWKFHNFGKRFFLPMLDAEQVRDSFAATAALDTLLVRYVPSGHFGYAVDGQIQDLSVAPSNLAAQEYLFESEQFRICVNGPGGPAGNYCLGLVGFCQSYTVIEGEDPASLKAIIETIFQRQLPSSNSLGHDPKLLESSMLHKYLAAQKQIL